MDKINSKINNEDFRQLAEEMPVLINAINEQGIFTYWNKACEEATGYSKEEIIGNQAAFTLLYPDPQYRKTLTEKWLKLNKEYHNAEIVLTSKDNRQKTILWTNLPKKFSPGEDNFWAIGLDISETKGLQQENQLIMEIQSALLRMDNEEDVCQLISEKAHSLIGDCIILASLLDYKKKSVSIKAYQGLKLPMQKIINLIGSNPLKTSFQLQNMSDEELSLFRSGKLEVLEGGIYALSAKTLSKPIAKTLEKILNIKKVYTIGFIQGNKHQGGLSILLQKKAELDHLAPLLESMVNQASITLQRLRAEQENRTSQRLFSALIQQAADCMLLHDQEGNILEVNHASCQVYGYTRDELLKMNIRELDPSSQDNNISSWEKLQEGDELFFEIRQINKKGIIFPAEARLKKITIEEKPCILGLWRDISSRKETENKLAAEKEYLSVTLRSIGDAVITTDTNGKIININPEACKLCGWTENEAKGNELSRVFSLNTEEGKPVELDYLKQEKSPLSIQQAYLLSRQGEKRLVSSKASSIKDEAKITIGYVFVFRDITEQKKMEAIMQRSDKLDSLGVLAGGIAHDFNNLFNGLFGYIDLAREYSRGERMVDHYLEKAASIFDRANSLTKQLLTFAKGGAPLLQKGNIKEIIQKNAEFVLAGSTIQFQIQAEENLWNGSFDPQQIAQVIDNILINAKQALSEKGKITIKISNQKLEKDSNFLSSGFYLKIEIQDEGPGIPAPIQKRIFDPFFTTRRGRTGLGLATAYSIIQKHNGHIEVQSEEGKGSCFIIFLPGIVDKIIKEGSPSIEKTGNTILLVDDEQFIRESTSLLLGSAGYRIFTAADSTEALKLCREFKEQNKKIDLALLDLIIPGKMGGKELVFEIKQFFPGIYPIAISGYSEDPIMVSPQDYGFSASLAKPFRKQDLLKLIKKE